MGGAATVSERVDYQFSSWTISALLHAVIFALLISNLNFFDSQPVPQLAIEAILLDSEDVRTTTRLPLEDPVPPEPAELPAPEPDPAVEQAELERLAAEAAAEKAAAEAAERARQTQLKLEQEKAAQLKVEQARKAAEAKERQAAEVRKQREAEEAKRREQAQRQAELVAAMQAEEELRAAQNSGAMAQYIALITQKVQRNWIKPPSAVAGLECQVAVKQLPNGDVVSVNITTCNGDAAVRRSVENAVYKASPLPLPQNRTLFERNLRFIFKPEQ